MLLSLIPYKNFHVSKQASNQARKQARKKEQKKERKMHVHILIKQTEKRKNHTSCI